MSTENDAEIARILTEDYEFVWRLVSFSSIVVYLKVAIDFIGLQINERIEILFTDSIEKCSGRTSKCR